MSTETGQRLLGIKLLTPEGPVFDGDIRMVIAPSVDGDVGILPRHAPLIAFLRVGETRLNMADGTTLVYATTEGYLSVAEDHVLMLVEQAEQADAIDVARAQAALQRAEEALATAGEDEVARKAAEAAKRRAENRILVAEKK